MIPEPNFPAKPDEFVGRKPQLEAFRQALRQGIATGRTPSFAVLGEMGDREKQPPLEVLSYLRGA